MVARGILKEPAQLDSTNSLIIRAWNMMDGGIDYSALEFIATFLNVNDMDILMSGLFQIKAYHILALEMTHGQ